MIGEKRAGMDAGVLWWAGEELTIVPEIKVSWLWSLRAQNISDKTLHEYH